MLAKRRFPGRSCSEGESIENREPWLVVGGSVKDWLVGGVLGLVGASGMSTSIESSVSCCVGEGQLAVLILK
jgi:hypothetical protein